MKGKIMHCGAKSTPISYLPSVRTPEPTESHYPIPHWDLYLLAMEELSAAGYNVLNEAHFLNREDAHYFGLLELDSDTREDGYTTMCALRNSHNKDFAASLAIGARVFVCDNLSFSGDIVVGRKHTLRIMDELPELLHRAVGTIKITQRKQSIRFEEYKDCPVSTVEVADHLIMEAYRRGIINLKRIGSVHREWEHPSEDQGDKTMWRFFNAVTRSVLPTSANQYQVLPARTIALHELCDEYADVGAALQVVANEEALADLPDQSGLQHIGVGNA